jgi:hypothetical protein
MGGTTLTRPGAVIPSEDIVDADLRDDASPELMPSRVVGRPAPRRSAPVRAYRVAPVVVPPRSFARAVASATAALAGWWSRPRLGPAPSEVASYAVTDIDAAGRWSCGPAYRRSSIARDYRRR